MFDLTDVFNVAKKISNSAIKKGICIHCHKPALVQAADGTSKYNPELFYSEPGKKEWSVSAMCERCFDTLFKEEDQDQTEEGTDK